MRGIGLLVPRCAVLAPRKSSKRGRDESQVGSLSTTAPPHSRHSDWHATVRDGVAAVLHKAAGRPTAFMRPVGAI